MHLKENIKIRLAFLRDVIIKEKRFLTSQLCVIIEFNIFRHLRILTNQKHNILLPTHSQTRLLI